MSDELLAALAGALVAFAGSLLLLLVNARHQSSGREREYRRLLKNVIGIMIKNIEEYEKILQRTNTFADVPIYGIGDQIQLFWLSAGDLAIHLDESVFTEAYELIAETNFDQRYWVASYDSYKKQGKEQGQSHGLQAAEYGKRIVARKSRLEQLRARL